MTRKRALEILRSLADEGSDAADDMRTLLDALDGGGAFPSEATEAEIANVAEQVFQGEREAWGTAFRGWRDCALRLASACRAMGLVPR